MTGERMKIMINDYDEKVETLVNTKLTELTNSFPLHPNRNDQASNENNDNDGVIFAEGGEELVVVNNNQTIRHRLYTYDGRFWHMPKEFEFHVGVHLGTGWKLWMALLRVVDTFFLYQSLASPLFLEEPTHLRARELRCPSYVSMLSRTEMNCRTSGRWAGQEPPFLVLEGRLVSIDFGKD